MIKQLLFVASIAIFTLPAPAYSEALPTEGAPPPLIGATLGPVADAETLGTALAVPSALPRGPQDLLNDYEAGMTSISQEFSARLGAIVQAVQTGELSRDEGENISAEQYQIARMQFELLSALHEILRQDIARATAPPPAPAVVKHNDTVTVSLPFSSLELNPSLAEYLELSPEQVSAIEKLMSEERLTLEPLMARMEANKTKLLAAGGRRPTNEKEVKALAATQAGMLTELIVANSQLQAKIDKLLTAEQQKKLDTVKRSSELSQRAGN